MNNVWTIVIVGATGDLSKRKLFPALYALLKRQEVSFRLVAVARESISGEQLLEKARPFIIDYDQITFDKLLSLTTYCNVDITCPQDFRQLAEIIDHIGARKRLVYCAVGSDLFCPLTSHLVSAGVLVRGNRDHSIIYEKPFGKDAQSARLINLCIEQLLDSSQIYRIDHYLAKEFVSNIVLMRCANILFSSIWDNKHIACVRIIMHEQVCLEGRGAFYDDYGALKDVVQNHLLQLLTLVALECPERLSRGDLSREKTAILQALRVENCIVGQYEGYEQEPNVRAGSTTETFAFLQLALDTDRWRGVPFYIETGKCLGQKRVEIQIVFKGVRPCAFQSEVVCNPNMLTIQLGPREGFTLTVNSKMPGKAWQAMPVKIDFCHDCLYGPETPQAYERVLLEVIAGERGIAVEATEIEAQWDVIDRISQKSELYVYKKGSNGPEEVKNLMSCEGNGQ
jgi:glucose-6-phosphate 1-dehydrogenase